MSESLGFLALVAALFLGAWGWGTAVVTGLGRAGWSGARREIGPALQIVLGVCLFLAVGGVLVACDLARFGVLAGWHVLGIAFLVVRTARVARRRGDNVRAWALGVSAAAVGVVLVLISLGVAIGSPFYNIYDDDGAYVYLAQRLVSTGGLIDPFNARRMTSYGGSTLYQSIFLHLFGNSSLRGFEFTFAALLLVIVTVQTFKRRWFALGTLVVGLGVLLGHGIGPVQNLSPTLSAAAPLSVGAYQLLGKVRTASEPDQPWLYAVLGIVLGGILALRFYYLISVVIATIIVLVLARGRRSWQPLLLCAGVGVLSVSGWAVALYRSSRSLLFPLFEGNYNPSYPVGPNPLASGIGSYAHQLWSVVNGYDVGWVALACIAVALGALVLGRGDRRLMLVLFGAGVGCLVQMVVFTVIFSGFAAIEIDRFEGPSTLACGLFALSALWPLRGPSTTTSPARHLASGRRLTMRGVEWRELLPGAATLVLLIGLATLIFGGTLGVVWRTSTNHVKTGIDVARGTVGFPDRYSAYRDQYARLNAAIPQGAKVFAAVDYPSLLSFSRYHFATLDLAGSVSPPPRMPYFSGAAAKVRYLRRLGYDYIVADAETERGLYQFKAWQSDLHSPRYNYRAWAPYFLDWMSSVTALEQSPSYPVQHFGPLALIRIDTT